MPNKLQNNISKADIEIFLEEFQPERYNKDSKIEDLSSHLGSNSKVNFSKPENPGIYFIYEGEELIYIGKGGTGSNPISQRILSHFMCWWDSFADRLIGSKWYETGTINEVVKKSNTARGRAANFKFRILPTSNQNEEVAQIEKALVRIFSDYDKDAGTLLNKHKFVSSLRVRDIPERKREDEKIINSWIKSNS